MKKAKDQILNVLIVMLVGVFATACNNPRQNENQDHGDMMNDDQTEMMEGNDDHMHEDGQSDEHMMNDTTSMDMNEEMGQ